MIKKEEAKKIAQNYISSHPKIKNYKIYFAEPKETENEYYFAYQLKWTANRPQKKAGDFYTGPAGILINKATGKYKPLTVPESFELKFI